MLNKSIFNLIAWSFFVILQFSWRACNVHVSLEIQKDINDQSSSRDPDFVLKSQNKPFASGLKKSFPMSGLNKVPLF